MPTLEELDQFVTAHIDNITRRPDMYASSPSALEDILMNLDLVLSFIRSKLTSSYQSNADVGYPSYLAAHGFGSATVSGRLRIDGDNTMSESEVYERIIKVWNLYRQSQFSP